MLDQGTLERDVSRGFNAENTFFFDWSYSRMYLDWELKVSRKSQITKASPRNLVRNSCKSSVHMKRWLECRQEIRNSGHFNSIHAEPSLKVGNGLRPVPTGPVSNFENVSLNAIHA